MNIEFESKVSRTVERHGMDLSRPLAMVSGGPDSVALLRVMVALGARPVVLHVDHGLRGEQSRADAEFVRRLCEELGLFCEVRALDLAEGTGLQERARRERYGLASDLALRAGATAIATGHTADDVAETVLMNLARGSGTRGLAGIPPVRGGIARPLIEVGRAEILRYLEALGQSYRTDPTNALPKYARNRVRNEVLPALEELYPGARNNIARAAGLLRQDLEALGSLAEDSLRSRGEELVVPDVSELHPALRRHALRLAYSRLAPSEPPLDSALVESVLGPEGGGTRTVDLPAGVVAAVRYSGEVSLYERREPPQSEALEVRPGKTELAGWVIEARELEKPRRLPGEAARPEVVYLDAERGPYALRLAREGDEVRPLGLGGSKKVLRAMMDRKVPKDHRRRTPVVVDGSDRVAWVAGGEVGEEFAVDEDTRRVLRLQASEAAEERKRERKSSIVRRVEKVLISSEQIQEKVRELGERITEDYRDKNPLLVGILRGAVIVLGDLMRRVDLPCEIDFMDISSYGTGSTSSGVVRIIKDLEEDITGRHVIIVEDIVDSGLTLSYLRRSLLARDPASLEIFALLSKPERRKVELPVKYLGFEIPNEFVVGYGLDFAGAYRNLPDICLVDPDEDTANPEKARA